jgi:hypothetical protein
MLSLVDTSVTISSQVALTLVAIATLARCAPLTRYAEGILAEWEGTDLARAALGGTSLRETIEQWDRQAAA